VHQPLVQGLAFFAQVHGHATSQQTFFGLVILLPVIMFIAWALFYTVERHTLTSSKRLKTEAAA
jgi:peptidoglycan/LPS O-acetylase OafA/YrhL